MRPLLLLVVATGLAGCAVDEVPAGTPAPPPSAEPTPTPTPAATQAPPGASTPALRLAEPRARIGAAAIDGIVYAFGGTDERRSFAAVEALDVRSGETRTLEATLPSPRDSVSAVAADGRIYVLGGVVGTRGTPTERFFDDILVFEPEAGTLAVSDLKLPTPRANMGVATDGVRLYLVGGDGLRAGRVMNLDEIVVVDLVNMTVETAPSRLPSGRNAPAVAWAEGSLYILGGNVDASTNVRDVLRYDGERVAPTAATLDEASAGGSAAWFPDRGCILVAGAHNGRTTAAPVCYHPGTDRVSPLPPDRPSERAHPGIALVDGAAHLVGGFDADRQVRSDVVVLRP